VHQSSIHAQITDGFRACIDDRERPQRIGLWAYAELGQNRGHRDYGRLGVPVLDLERDA
jgi:hypothetical protein